MQTERISHDTTEVHKGETLPWLLPATGVHTTEFVLDDIMAAFEVGEDVAATLIYEHPSARTSYDAASVTPGCGCGWVSDEIHASDDEGRRTAAEDLAVHLREQVARIEFRGTSDV